MDTPAATKSPDIWPPTSATKACCIPGGVLYVEVARLSEGHLLTALSRSIHQEMQCAGGWAARRAQLASVEDGLISPQALSRRFADGAARLLSIYTALHAAVRPSGTFDITPEQLRSSVSSSYQYGFHLERQRQQEQQSASFNDDLHAQVSSKPQAERSRVHR